MDYTYAKELRERRAKIAHEIAEIGKLARAEDRTFTPEERARFDAMNADLDSLAERIEDAERIERVSLDLSEPADEYRLGQQGYQLAGGKLVDREPADKGDIITREDHLTALHGFLLGPSEATAEQREAAKKVGLDIGRDRLQLRWDTSLDYAERRRRFREDGIVYRATTSQSVGTNAAGGFTVPTELREQLEEALLAFGGMRQVATVIRTARGGTYNIPTVDETESGAIIGENTATVTADVTFAQVAVADFKYTSNMVKVSRELLQDNVINLVSYLGRALGTRVARKLNTDFTNGSATGGTPRGITTDSQQGVAATTATGDVSHTTLLNLLHSVDPEYRMRPGSGWMMNDGLIKEIRQIVDSQGRPLWEPSLKPGVPDGIYGYPITTNQDMVSSTTGAGQKTMLFGDLGAYLIRDVAGIELLRLDERFAEKGQTAWLTFSRHGGRLLTASTVAGKKPVKHVKGTT